MVSLQQLFDTAQACRNIVHVPVCVVVAAGRAVPVIWLTGAAARFLDSSRVVFLKVRATVVRTGGFLAGLLTLLTRQRTVAFELLASTLKTRHYGSRSSFDVALFLLHSERHRRLLLAVRHGHVAVRKGSPPQCRSEGDPPSRCQQRHDPVVAKADRARGV